ncbi:hypothetical protein ANCCAN_17617 [Ancylostoma caninum]|uniref:DUF5641 domain-containing protein n=1 Tax=Ancylostoma caninum TaxID=29170 RepID=A0A368FWC3_ANCCA|nr:hypothetical protein ANCCAN_17617 [Ancylostoma caninum]
MENNLAKISGTEIAIAGKILVKQHQLTTITPPLRQSLKHLNIKQDQNGTATLTFEQLSTVLVEIESLINTKPLLHVESNTIGEQVLRPIDFLQNEFEVPYPLDELSEDKADPLYLPPDEQVFIKTKQQAIKALQSSCQFTERFWRIWKTQYLAFLREKHQRDVGKGRSSKNFPKIDDIVLISEPIQPRQSWKLGRIQELVSNSEGIVREAIIVLPSRRQIRRPVNLLVPVELDDGQHCKSRKDESLSRDMSITSGNIPAIPTEGECEVEQSINNGQRTCRYNLRPRRQANYIEFLTPLQMTNIPLILTVLLTIVVMGEPSQTASSIPSLHLGNHSQTRRLRCIEGGVDLISTKQAPYEVCAEEFCRIYDTPQVKKTVRFPTQVVLHEHRVQWKFINDVSVNTIETTCPPAPFCEHLDCTFCSAVIFNPEYWPFKAILARTVLLYFVITGCYV